MKLRQFPKRLQALSPSRALPAGRMLLCACAALLAGCGGGSSPASVPVSKDGATGTTGTSSRTVAYDVTDLGAADYYYGYYGSINNFGRYGPRIALNDKAQLVTASNGVASIYDGALHTLTGSYSGANAINGASQVAGYSQSAANDYATHATVWQADGTPVDLGTLGGYSSVANGIADNGQVVGQSDLGFISNYQYAAHAFLRVDLMVDLGTLGGDYSTASAINNGQLVVGWSTLANAQSLPGYYGGTSYPVHAFMYAKGAMTDLGTLPGGQSSDAAAVNDPGYIVGSSSTTPQGLYGFAALHAVYWYAGVIHDMGTLGGPSSIGYGINSAGAMVGSADTLMLAPTPPPYAAYYGTGGLGGSGAGNSTGTTGGTGGLGGGGEGGSVGAGTGSFSPISAGAGGGIAHKGVAASAKTSATAGRAAAGVERTRGLGDTYISHAFLYANGKMTDLNTQISDTPGWELLQATDINNKGQIVGYGTLGNHLHAFLMTPK